MIKQSNRDKLLKAGLRVVHERGFAFASVRDIVKAAGVPQGSFTNHFESKEAFGLEVIDLYFTRMRALMAETLLNPARPPLARLKAYIDANQESLCRDDMKLGCLVGNFAAETGAHSDAVRGKLNDTFVELQQALTRMPARGGEGRRDRGRYRLRRGGGFHHVVDAGRHLARQGDALTGAGRTLQANPVRRRSAAALTANSIGRAERTCRG